MHSVFSSILPLPSPDDLYLVEDEQGGLQEVTDTLLETFGYPIPQYLDTDAEEDSLWL